MCDWALGDNNNSSVIFFRLRGGVFANNLRVDLRSVCVCVCVYFDEVSYLEMC